MTDWQLFVSAWDWEPSVIAGCAAMLLAYFAALRFQFPKVAWYFITGVMVLLLALVSPVDTLGDTYLFSAHMLQHILLILIVPPLLLLGVPRDLAQRILRRPLADRTERVLSRPVLAWTLGVGTMWIWHWPPLYNAALASEPIHIVEHLLFLVTATIFWWPVISPIEELRLAPLGAVIYVFGACVAHTVLAILLTFAPLGLYPAYLQPVDTLHILPLLRDRWGLTPRADQQWGGLLMWVPACLVYLSVLLATLARWYRIPERDELVASLAMPPATISEAPGEAHGR
ncbi:MAG: cytochrome c oxidase assembly protein [Candidatus Acidiferrales bacterium]